MHQDIEPYIATIDEFEDMIIDDTKFPVVEDNKIKMLCKLIAEFIKIILQFLKNNILDATKKKKEH